MGFRTVIINPDGLKIRVRETFNTVIDDATLPGTKKKLERLKKEVLESIERYLVIEQEEQRPTEQPKCVHKWRDFDWYLEFDSSKKNRFKYTIIEPYVCIHCGARKNVTLESGTMCLDDGDTTSSVLEDFNDQYPRIKPKAIVEDEINDSILVDREYLRIADYLSGRGRLDSTVQLKL